MIYYWVVLEKNTETIKYILVVKILIDSDEHKTFIRIKKNDDLFNDDEMKDDMRDKQIEALKHY